MLPVITWLHFFKKISHYIATAIHVIVSAAREHFTLVCVYLAQISYITSTQASLVPPIWSVGLVQPVRIIYVPTVKASPKL